jgi:hypothetical protein
MTYPNRTHVREHEVKVRLNEHELAVVEALAQFNQRQRAVFVRELMLEGLALLQQRNDIARAA